LFYEKQGEGLGEYFFDDWANKSEINKIKYLGAKI